METSGIIALLVAIVLSRLINERAYRTLEDEEKLRLMDGFSKSRAYSMIPIIVIIGIFYFLITQTEIQEKLITTIYFIILIVYVIFRALMNQRKLKELNIPASYTRLFTWAQILSFAGVGWFLYTLMA